MVDATAQTTITLELDFVEASVIQALLSHVRFGHGTYSDAAQEISEALEEVGVSIWDDSNLASIISSSITFDEEGILISEVDA
jgi:hypothetical protein